MNPLIMENDQVLDVFQKLSNERIIFIDDTISDELATEISATLIQKDLDSNEMIHIFINSDGGSIKDVLTIYDTMKIIKSPVRTVGTGLVAQEAVLLLSAGTVGQRFLTKNAIVIGSQVYHEGVYHADLTDAKIILDLIQQQNSYFIKELSGCIGKKEKQLMKDFENKKYMNADQAIQYGIADKVVNNER